VLARLRRLGLPDPVTVVVGFSGGPDSLALAGVLGRLADSAPLRPVLCHVDHRLRPGSGEEQRAAAHAAAALGLPFRGAAVAADPRVLHPGVGLEEAARRERYRLLAAAAGEVGADLVALAHHEADQAETVLLHLLRGAGLTGAAGMAEFATRAVPWWPDRGPRRDILVWRPLLGESREDVRDYAAALGIAPIADPSNEEIEPRRNALRRQALPLLERIVPGGAAALARFAALAAADDEVMEHLAIDAWRHAARPGGTILAIGLRDQPRAIRRRVVRRWLRETAALPAVSFERIEAVLGLLEPGPGGRRVEVGNGRSVVVVGGELRLVGGRGSDRQETAG